MEGLGVLPGAYAPGYKSVVPAELSFSLAHGVGEGRGEGYILITIAVSGSSTILLLDSNLKPFGFLTSVVPASS